MSFLLTAKRRVVQSISLVLLNTNFWSIGSEKFCLPIMNCEACVFAWLGCPIGMMGARISFMAFPLLVVGVVILLGFLFGRFLCGWVCPMGFLSDLLYKIPSPKFGLPRFTTWAKYGFLLITVVAAAFVLGTESRLFYCRFCPTATLQVVLPAMITGQESSFDVGRVLRFSVLTGVVLLAVGHQRGFCKVMCPVGALVAITNKMSRFAIRLNGPKCVACGKCDANCPMTVPVSGSAKTGRLVNRDTECIGCLSCEGVCPTGAITNNSKVLRGPARPNTPQVS